MKSIATFSAESTEEIKQLLYKMEASKKDGTGFHYIIFGTVPPELLEEMIGSCRKKIASEAIKHTLSFQSSGVLLNNARTLVGDNNNSSSKQHFTF